MMDSHEGSTKAEARRNQVLYSFKAKLSILEELVTEKQARKPLRIWYPLTLKEFREWESPGRFSRWVSQSIDAPNGKYPDLAKRLKYLLKALHSDPLLEENATLRRENLTLIEQNVKLEMMIQTMKDKFQMINHAEKIGDVANLYGLPYDQ